MAVVYPTTNLIGTGIQLSSSTTPAIADGDLIVIDQDISVVSTTSHAIYDRDATSLALQNYGLIAAQASALQWYGYTTDVVYSVENGVTGRIVSEGDFAVYLGSISANSPDSRVTFNNAGQISSHNEDAPVFLFYTGVARFDNSGTISSSNTSSGYSSVSFYAIDIVRATNSGLITAANSNAAAPTHATIAAVSFVDATDDVIFHNSGRVSAPLYSIGSTATSHELITNSGILEGDVTLSNTIGGVLQNSGAIWGDVELNGGDDDYRGYGTGFVSGTVFGGVGNDTLIGSDAADSFDGGENDDILRGRKGDDTLIGGANNDRLYGNEGADRLQGDAGDDTLFGGDGDDTIVGGNGLDVLFGGAGADTFSYNSFADSVNGGAFDRIRDFTPGEDKINLSSVAAGLDFVDGAFTGTGPEVRVQVTSAGVPLVFVDYNGDAVADMRIALLGTTEPVTESDFIL